MAKRPVFISNGRERLVKEELVDFKWNPGVAPIQKKKNVSALHEAAEKKGFSPLLEISTKSQKTLGQRLSAFNLKIGTDIGEINLEAAYQGSKVFESGGPYTDIYRKDGRNAKKDIRVRTSGELVCFYRCPLLAKPRALRDALRRIYQVLTGSEDIWWAR